MRVHHPSAAGATTASPDLQFLSVTLNITPGSVISHRCLHIDPQQTPAISQPGNAVPKE